MTDLEAELAYQMRACGIEYQEQVKAVAGRRFTWDFQVNNVLIEVQGGIWKKGGHSTGRGITRDCEKANLAALHGYKTLFFTAEMVHSGEAVRMIEEVK